MEREIVREKEGERERRERDERKIISERIKKICISSFQILSAADAEKWQKL